MKANKDIKLELKIQVSFVFQIKKELLRFIFEKKMLAIAKFQF